MASERTPSRRLIDLDDIGGLGEVAELLGISRQAVSNWAAGRARPGFPEPLKRLHATPLYSLSEVATWYKSVV
jgi:chromosome partitioning protein